MRNKSSAAGWFWMVSILFCVLVASSAGAVTVVVTNPTDTLTGCSTLGTGTISGGGCTLRDAITFSDANPEPPGLQNLIQFNIPGGGLQTITLASPLPPITTAVVIDGYSQPGATPNTLAVGDDAVLLILLEGGNLFESFNDTVAALTVNGGTGSLVQGLILQANFAGEGPDTIDLYSCCNTIIGNSVQYTYFGIFSDRNRIGGPAPADRNAMSSQLYIPGDHNTVEGNEIVNSNQPHGAISVSGSSSLIGGSSGRGNVISGNASQGIVLGGTRNVVAGNLIGTDPTGLSSLPNLGEGILAGGSENVIGTPLTGPAIFRLIYPGNVIAFNRGNGISVTGERNFIGFNSVFSNDGLGIDLGGDGVTGNDPCDSDAGANGLQNYPLLTDAIARQSGTQIQGTLSSAPNTVYRVQLFANHSCDPSGFGEGEAFLDEVVATTDDNCDASFTAVVPAADAPVGQFITATATDPEGNTSEFSACLEVSPLLIPTQIRFLVEGPIRVAPGVPVQFRFKVEAKRPGLAGDLSGEVVVSDDQGDVCRDDVSLTGEGASPLTFGARGNYRVRAHYLGNATFEESTSPPVPVLVGMPGGLTK